MTKNTKTGSQKVEAARIALAKAEASAAREAAKGNPVIESLTEALDSINADINIHSRLLNGPNSFENRLASIRLRADWIDAQMTLTIAQDELLRAQKISLQAHIDNLAERVADGETEIPTASQVLRDLPQPQFAQFIEDEYHAKNAWKDSTPSAITARQKAEKNATATDDSVASAQ
tara:strand:- start:289 stop:816 length:528 start_codon:yes stop_codon:yes gene_type:complete